VPEDRLAGALDHRLGSKGGLLGQSRAEAAGEYHCLHGGEIRPYVWPVGRRLRGIRGRHAARATCCAIRLRLPAAFRTETRGCARQQPRDLPGARTRCGSDRGRDRVRAYRRPGLILRSVGIWPRLSVYIWPSCWLGSARCRPSVSVGSRGNRLEMHRIVRSIMRTTPLPGLSWWHSNRSLETGPGADATGPRHVLARIWPISTGWPWGTGWYVVGDLPSRALRRMGSAGARTRGPEAGSSQLWPGMRRSPDQACVERLAAPSPPPGPPSWCWRFRWPP
jgi:hypothetical protein